MKYNLGQVCYYVKEKIKVSELSKLNYISTENMLPNKCGIRVASVLPKAEYVQKYIKDDILISNIRPYFQKIPLLDSDFEFDSLACRLWGKVRKYRFLHQYQYFKRSRFFPVFQCHGYRIATGNRNSRRNRNN